MKPNKPTKNFSGVWMIAGLNVIALGLLAALGWLLQSELAADRAAETELLALSDRLENLETNRRLAAEFSAESKTISAAFVNPGTVPELIESLERLAKTARVSFRLTRAEVVKQGDQPALSLELAAAGSFAALNHFFALVETLPQVVRFTALELNRSGDGWSGRAAVDILSYHDEEI